MRKKQQIERYWNCSIGDAIPKSIRPRYTAKRGSMKARIGEPAPEAEWWRWSKQLFYRLENLASMTPGRLAFAQALMQAAVNERQKDSTARHREAAEIMRSDLVKVIAELKRRTIMGENETDESEEDELDDDEQEELEGERYHEHLLQEEPLIANSATMDAEGDSLFIEELNRAIKAEPDSDTPPKRRLSQSEIPPAQRHKPTPSQPATHAHANREALETKANIASLRAAAARLRHQASQREAKAYKLEAEMWEREAGEAE